MKTCLIFGWTLLLVCGIRSVFLGDTVGTPPMAGFALSGLGQTVPRANNYRDFVVKGATDYSYLVFGGPYDSGDWDDWITDVYYLAFRYTTEAEGLWLGFAVGAAGDVTGDGQTYRDVLIGDIRYLDICDPEDAKGKAWLVHGISYTTDRPTITLDAEDPPEDCELTEISSAEAGNWFGCALGWAGNMNRADEDDFIIGACLSDDITNSHADAGRTYVFLGDDSMASSLDTDDGVAFTGESQYDHFGCAIAGMQA